MRCLNCNHDNSPGGRYCANCGAELIGPASLPAGQTMNHGQYRVVRQLGKGGMGAIYLAQNTQAFDRLCVIKQLIAYHEPGEEQKAQERFETEARTLAALKHPGIPDMYGYFTERGRNYIVMEYIEGQNLEQLMEGLAPQEGLAPEDVARYGVEICRVLEYLSEIKPEPVVHCDIKPANIIIDRNSRQAVLVDFGTAKARYRRALAQSPDSERPSVYGTVGYAPAELYRGQAAPKSDVFSLAATLYYLLTHDDPRDHPFKWLKMEQLPAEWRLLLERALAGQAEQRPDATQFRQQIEAYRAARNGTVQPLTFPGGNMATTLTGVLDLSLRHWDYARQILYDGSLDAWLRQTLHDPVAANRAREAVSEHADHPDSGLNAFVRGLNPRLPTAVLAMSSSTLNLGDISDGAEAVFKITLHNRGPGGAHGSLSCSVPWLRASQNQFALGPGKQQEITLHLLRDRLPARGQLSGTLLAKDSAGQSIEVPIHGRVKRRAPRQGTSRTAVVAATQSASASKKPGRKANVAWILLALLLAVAAATIMIAQLSGGVSETALERGLTAIEQGDWQRAVRTLGNLNPTDAQQVHRVAQALDAQMVAVAEGTLQMGSEESLAADQKPVHSVDVQSFWMDRFEVTNVQYQRFVDETQYAASSAWRGRRFTAGKALHPVVGVSWGDALAYAEWAGKRLPTEAEWEWAARGAEGRAYPWGEAEGAGQANTQESGLGEAAPVGASPGDATPLGIQDLAGNVREWTADRYGPYREPYIPPPDGEYLVARGSSFASYNDAATARQKVLGDTRADDLGFRCAR